jgi:hypothetical protein
MKMESPSNSKAGQAPWESVTGDFDLAENELVILRQAVATLDTLAVLAAVVDAEGPMQPSPQGTRVHPCLAGSSTTAHRLGSTVGEPESAG